MSRFDLRTRTARPENDEVVREIPRNKADVFACVSVSPRPTLHFRATCTRLPTFPDAVGVPEDGRYAHSALVCSAERVALILEDDELAFGIHLDCSKPESPARRRQVFEGAKDPSVDADVLGLEQGAGGSQLTLRCGISSETQWRGKDEGK